MLYYIGLIFVVLLILISIDDLFWDIYYFISRLFGKFKKESIDFKEVEKTKPKMLAVLVAAYREENVLKQVIENMVRSNHYPNSMYHIFLGVYPNDPYTQKVADELVDEFENVHKVIHRLDGPSSKADNLNNMIANLDRFQKDNYLEFAAIVIHDSEDLIHPYEFKLENYLLESYQAIQMPVFPLHEKTKIRNLYENIISGTYADEFAENHYRLLVARTLTGAFVPSAGTGFVIRRDVLESYPNFNVFPVGSLTEDYKLSLQMKENGYDVHYALADVEKTLEDGRVVREFVSTRSMFPSNYKAAVKQKTRWIYGITMQSFSFDHIIKSKNLNFQSKYSLYRDWKAKFGNLLLGPGYLIFLYFIGSIFIDLPAIYPRYSLSWYLMVFLSIMMIERQFLRFTAVNKVYGIRSAVASTLLPPILPIKMLVGNIINFHATVKAWLTKFSLNKKKKKVKKVGWSKTDHEFLEEQVLEGFRRNLADVLLYRGVLTKNQISRAIKNSKLENKSLAQYLKDQKIVETKIIVKSICEIEQKTYIDLKPGRYLNYYVKKYGADKLKSIKAIPLIKLEDKMIVISSLDGDKDLIKKTLNEYNIKFFYSSEEQIFRALAEPEVDEVIEEDIILIEDYIRKGYINTEQALIALSFNKPEDSIDETLNKMGLLKI